jgi:peptide/nickel transport system substrate-binding protein
MSWTWPRAAALAVALPGLGAAWPQPGGALRLRLPSEPWDPTPAGLQVPADLALCGATFGTLLRASGDGQLDPLLARSLERLDLPDGGERWTVRLDPLARFPDGSRVAAADVVASWERLLRSRGSPYRFLLGPVAGAAAYASGAAHRVEGLSIDGGDLAITTTRPTPDMAWRLAHPALGIGRFHGDLPHGSGPFLPGGEELGPNRFFADGAPFLERLVLLEQEGVDPSLLLQAGEADAALLYGRDAGALVESPPAGVRLQRAAGWDRAYALALNPASGFFAGQVDLRRLLAAAIDREEIVRLLFDGRGAPAGSLLASGPPPAAVGPPVRLSGTRQPITLSHDRTDPVASRIASRLKAAWENLGLRVHLEGLEPPALRGRVVGGAHDVALLLHQAATDDPLLALRGTLGGLGPGHDDALDALRGAERLADAGARLEAALAAEAMLAADQRLIPLIRLHAWLAAGDRLVGIDAGAAGALRLDDAFFLP